MVVLLLLVGTVLLIWSMNRHLKNLPKNFDWDHPEDDQAADDGTDGDPDCRRPAPGRGARDGGKQRLAEATSPYLRQHADNPVHWQQWSADALAWPRERDVPILLSVGYAACHWCHVMAHESFEDPAAAAVMNRHFVCIKVDREERPDIDAIYMNATVAMTGQGGWPMTCFLTPDGEPFYCGTYYPHGLPSSHLLRRSPRPGTSPRRGRAGVDGVAEQIARAWRRGCRAAARPSTSRSRARGAACSRDEDPDYGGFGGAPKFPPSALLEG